MAKLELLGIGKTLTTPNTVRLFDDLTLHVNSGEFAVLFGESGCGKSTLLRIAAGLDTSYVGTVKLAGRDITKVAVEQRNIGFMTQHPALFPHLSVAENIAFPLLVRQQPAKSVWSRLSSAAQLPQQQEQILHIAELTAVADLLSHRPQQLSGGQQQRVALARCLVQQPDVLLLDEPFSNLDREARQALRTMVKQLQRQLRMTVVMVTHDYAEAMLLADTVIALGKNNTFNSSSAPVANEQNDQKVAITRVVQSAMPQDVYTAPVNLQLASLFAEAAPNYLQGTLVFTIRDNSVTCKALTLEQNNPLLTQQLQQLRFDSMNDALDAVDCCEYAATMTFRASQARVSDVHEINGNIHTAAELLLNEQLSAFQTIATKDRPLLTLLYILDHVELIADVYHCHCRLLTSATETAHNSVVNDTQGLAQHNQSAGQERQTNQRKNSPMASFQIPKYVANNSQGAAQYTVLEQLDVAYRSSKCFGDPQQLLQTERTNLLLVVHIQHSPLLVYDRNEQLLGQLQSLR